MTPKPSTITETVTMAPPEEDPDYLQIDEAYMKNTDADESLQQQRSGQSMVWRNVVLLSALHLIALLGIYDAVFIAQWKTIAFACLMYIVSGFGITMGAHRLWTHRSYKARTPLRIFLMLCNCTTAQNDIIEWSRDHRGHHKWTDTDADPHNARRGLFFTHIGWLLVRKHPEVITRGKTLIIDDIANDPVCAFQRRYYKPLAILFTFVLPTVIPYLCWGESLSTGYLVPGVLRYVVMLNAEWCVNSVAHTFGNRPYDAHIKPTESVWTSIVTFGEGWHNYHHAFPSDYKASELPCMVDLTTACIDLCARVGLAYDLKTASDKMIKAKIERSGPKTIKQT